MLLKNTIICRWLGQQKARTEGGLGGHADERLKITPV
jgi:hypothetical protein